MDKNLYIRKMQIEEIPENSCFKLRLVFRPRDDKDTFSENWSMLMEIPFSSSVEEVAIAFYRIHKTLLEKPWESKDEN